VVKVRSSSLTIVFLLAPVIRTIARMLLPSTIMPRIWARRSVENLFITDIYTKALSQCQPKEMEKAGWGHPAFRISQGGEWFRRRLSISL
jgi:hypothetical protein